MVDVPVQGLIHSEHELSHALFLFLSAGRVSCGLTMWRSPASGRLRPIVWCKARLGSAVLSGLRRLVEDCPALHREIFEELGIHPRHCGVTLPKVVERNPEVLRTAVEDHPSCDLENDFDIF